MKKVRLLSLVRLSFALLTTTLGCSSPPTTTPMRVLPQGEGVATSSIPAEMKDNYSLFANRCSKCHSLARALNNGDHDANYWARYVARMRRQPSSGIAPEDEPPILKFLNFYSAQLRADNVVDAGAAVQ